MVEKVVTPIMTPKSYLGQCIGTYRTLVNHRGQGANLLGCLLNLTVEQSGREEVVIDAFRCLSVRLRICPGEFCQLDTSYIQLG